MDKQLVETERNLLFAIKKLDECLRQEFQTKFDTLESKFKDLETQVENLQKEKESANIKKCDEDEIDVVEQLKVLEEAVMKSSLLRKAVDLVTVAVELDKTRLYEEALRLYEQSIDLFLNSIKFEAVSEKAKESIRIKTITYLDRANKIKKYLKDKGYGIALS